LHVRVRGLCRKHYDAEWRAGKIPSGQAATENDPSLPVGECEQCGAEFPMKREWQRFCGPLCQRRAKALLRYSLMLAESPEQRAERLAKKAERARSRWLDSQKEAQL